MLVFSVNGTWKQAHTQTEDTVEYFFAKLAKTLTEKFPSIASIYYLENTGLADIVTGKPVLLFGKPSITEELLGLSFDIQPKSFFQVNTFGAEKLYTEAMSQIHHK